MNDEFDNRKDDRAMLRKLRDQEITVNNDDERDPDEFEILVTRDSRGFQISTAALRQAVDSGSAVIRFTAPDGYQFGRDRRLHPEGTWQQRAEEAEKHEAFANTAKNVWARHATEAEAALTAIGGIVRAYQNFPSEIDVVGEIERILRAAGQQADQLMDDQPHVHPRSAQPDSQPHVPHAHPGGHLPHDHQDEDL